MSPYYYNTLTNLRFKSQLRKCTIEAKTYFTYGEFLKNIMVPSKSLIEYMHFLYPNFDKEKYNSVHLRFGGNLADIPVFVEFMTIDSLNLIIKCIHFLPKNSLIYIASDSLIMKKKLDNVLKEYKLVYSTNQTIPADTQMMKSNLVSYATFSAVAELYILGHGQQCIMTTRSTYSLAMCALTGKKPIIILPKNNVCDTHTYSDYIDSSVCISNNSNFK